MTIERIRKQQSTQMTPEQHRKADEQFLRKHFTSFSESEINVLHRKLSYCVLDDVFITPHFQQRKHDYSFPFSDREMLDVIHSGMVVEYKRCRRNRPIERFVIRDMSGTHHRIVVIQREYHRWTAVTGWINAADDMHSTLDTSIYDEFSIHDCEDHPKTYRNQ